MTTTTLSKAAGEQVTRHCGNSWMTSDGVVITVNGTDEYIVNCICNAAKIVWVNGDKLRETINFIRNHETN